MAQNNSVMSIVILDAIGKQPIGRDLHNAFVKQSIESIYVNLLDLELKKFYKFRRSCKKALNKLLSIKGYFYPEKPSKKALDSIRSLIETRKPTIILAIAFTFPYFSKQFLQELKTKSSAKPFLYDTEFGNFMANRDKAKFFMRQEIPRYDRVLSFSKKFVEFLGNDRAFYFPFGYNPINFSAVKEKKYDICFVGNVDMRRVFVLEQLKNYNIVIYGKKWENYKGVVSDELFAKIKTRDVLGEDFFNVIQNSKIVLNITNLGFYSLETGINHRVTLALALKSFLLTDYYEELNELFEVGKEIETYRSTEELIEKIDYYVKNDSEREEIASRGYNKYLQQFTWEKRAEKFIELFSEKLS